MNISNINSYQSKIKYNTIAINECMCTNITTKERAKNRT